MKKSATGLVVATLALFSLPLCAQASGLPFNAWDFRAGVGSLNTPYCAILSATMDKNVGQKVIVKKFTGTTKKLLVVDLFNDKWNWKPNSKMNITFDFTDNAPITLEAYANGPIIDVEFPTRDATVFLSKLAQAPALRVMFPTTRDEAWIIPSNNASNAVNQLAACVQQR